MDLLIQSCRLAWRQLIRRPRFTLFAIALIALGTGVNTAIFSVIDAVLFRPLPFADPGRLVRVYESIEDRPGRAGVLPLSEHTMRHLRDHHRDWFSGFAAAAEASLTMDPPDGTSARFLRAARISADFLPVLGIKPLLGRPFTAEEDAPGGPRAVLLGHDLWQARFGGRPEIIGQTIRLDGAVHSVVGVMPPGFRHPNRAEAWVPLAAVFAPGPSSRSRYLYGVARLRPDVSVATAEGSLRGFFAGLDRANPDPNNPKRGHLVPLREVFVQDLRPKLLTIQAAAICTLLVAAVNLAALSLARIAQRKSDFSLRAALGASPRALMIESLLQSGMVAVIGGALGLLFAQWATPALMAMSPEGTDATGSVMRDFGDTARVSLPVFLATVGTLLLVSIGLGILPAWRAAQTDARDVLSRGSSRLTPDPGTRRLLRVIVIGEVAVALVLLAATTVMGQHFRNLTQRPWGFAVEDRFSFNLSINAFYPAASDRISCLETLLDELRSMPGYRSATVTLPHPFHSAHQTLFNNPEGVPPPEPSGLQHSYFHGTMPGYFAAMGLPLLRGRDFNAFDSEKAPPVCIVSESYVRRFWPGQEVIGRRVKWGRIDNPKRPWFTVVGVVSDTNSVSDPNNGQVDGEIYFPLAQLLPLAPSYFQEFSVVMELAGNPPSIEQHLAQAIGRTDRRLAVYGFSSLVSHARQMREIEKFALLLILGFSVLCVGLAAIGIFGLLSMIVTQRYREIGVRLALGADGAQISRLILSEGLSLAVMGLASGGLGIWATMWMVQQRWPELPSLSPGGFGLIVVVYGAIVGMACWPPALRARRADPLAIMQQE